MSIDKYINFPLSQKNTLIPPRVSKIPPTEIPVVARTPKKMRLRQLPHKEITSAMMKVIRKVRVERLPEYFEQTCDRRQNETAVIYGSSQLTYQELDHRANRLAHFLISRGIEEGDLVGILLERSLDSYIALLGVLKAGAAFVPIDPSFPPDQIAFIEQDAGLRDVVTTCSFREKTSALCCPILELDQANEAISVQSEKRPQIRVDPESPCYIIYTLGTTNQSRGVIVSHSNIVNFLRVVTPIYNIKRHDRVYQGMSPASDLSFEEIWPTWIAGATLIADPSDSQRIGHELTEFLNEYKITVLRCMSGQLATIKDAMCPLYTRFS